VISVIIPTLRAEGYVADITRSLSGQTLRPNELIVIDSASEDGTVEAFENTGAKLVRIERDQFHHATVRNLGARLATGDIVVFMTQDALPVAPDCLERLVAPLRSGEASASFARQVPGPGATPLERFARETNYPSESRTVGFADARSLGSRAFFFSNSFSAVTRRAFEELGGFPEHTVMNEDMLFAARLLREGHRIAYVAEARVEHHHDYDVMQTFRRYFDIGAVFYQARDELAGLPLAGDGARYVGKLLTRLTEERNYHWIPVALAESAAKLAGLALGRQCHRLPRSWTKLMSMHPHYWHRRR
jgi:rhamnosyltransferase